MGHLDERTDFLTDLMSRSHYWIWCPIMGPILGGLFGAFLYDALLYTGEDNIFAKRFADNTSPNF